MVLLLVFHLRVRISAPELTAKYAVSLFFIIHHSLMNVWMFAFVSKNINVAMTIENLVCNFLGYSGRTVTIVCRLCVFNRECLGDFWSGAPVICFFRMKLVQSDFGLLHSYVFHLYNAWCFFSIQNGNDSLFKYLDRLEIETMTEFFEQKLENVWANILFNFQIYK